MNAKLFKRLSAVILTMLVCISTHAENIKFPEYKFRLKLDEKSHVEPLKDFKNIHVISNDEGKYLYLVTLKSADEKRFTYYGAVDSDTLYFNVGELTKQNLPLFSSKITKEYQCKDGRQCRSKIIFARQYVYIIHADNQSNFDYQDQIIKGFKSTRTGFIDNQVSMLGDRMKGRDPSGFWNFIVTVFVTLFNIAWATLIFIFTLYMTGRFIYLSKGVSEYVLSISMFIVAFFVFSFLCLHDYLMDWFAGYGSFWAIIVNLLSMLADD